MKQVTKITPVGGENKAMKIVYIFYLLAMLLGRGVGLARDDLSS